MIHVGDCLSILPTLDAESVQTIVTSPPYYALRDYELPPTDWPEVHFSPMAGLPAVAIPAMSCCLGLEPDPLAFIGHLVLIFRRAHRALRQDGTLWLNLGDSYAGNGAAYDDSTTTLQGGGQSHRMGAVRVAKRGAGLKSKDQMGIPWRAAFALQADGWYLRQDIVWSKPNPMPESVIDRCTKSHEYLFLLTKSPRYYFDAEAIAEPLAASSVERLNQSGLADQAGSDRVPGKTNGNMKAVRAKGNRKTFRGGGVYTQGRSFDNDADACNDSIGNAPNERDTRNRRSVWTVATQPFKEAHFATFPPALIEPCILAGSRPGDIVLDPYMGAGTTAVVAQKFGRKFLGCELNPDYAAIALRRLHATQPGLALGSAA